jgi:hypothetical protein
MQMHIAAHIYTSYIYTHILHMYIHQYIIKTRTNTVLTYLQCNYSQLQKISGKL